MPKVPRPDDLYAGIADLKRRVEALERVPVRPGGVTDDPADLVLPEIWIRSDTGQLCWWDGTTIHRAT